MDNYRDFALLSGEDNRYRYKSAFGEDHIRFQIFDQFSGFTEAFDYTERICKVLYAEVTSEFAGRDSVVRNTEWFDEFLFNAVI